MDQQSKQKASPAEVNQPATSLPFNALDVNRLFKGKTDKGRMGRFCGKGLLLHSAAMLRRLNQMSEAEFAEKVSL